MKIVINQMMTVSSPPHIYGTDSIEKRMRYVLIALFPAFFMSVYHYGIQAFYTTAIAVISALITEYLYQRVMGKPVTVNDFSAAITGVLLGFNLPPDVPFWLPVVGSFFAVIVVKQLFGGLGSNFVNPALGARAFLIASFPVLMNNWTFAPDAVTGATYLNVIKADPSFSPELSDYVAVLFGKIGGCIGEVSAVALLIGGVYLLVRKVINWRIPVFYLGSFAVFALIFGRGGFFSVSWWSQNILFELLNGGLILGAFFMATDYATSPITPNGKIVMGIGCGFLTALIRFHGGYPEGVCFSILIMNLFVPLIDKYIRPRVYGTRRKI